MTEKKYNIKLPPNTLTNADGTAYSAGHDRAIDEQKMKAHQYARAFVDKLYGDLCSDGWIDEGELSRREQSACRDTLEESLQEFALAILKETQSQ